MNLVATIKRLFAKVASEPAERPWLVDRDGRVHKPGRKVVLRAKPQGEQTNG